jgi:hypothetical protein
MEQWCSDCKDLFARSLRSSTSRSSPNQVILTHGRLGLVLYQAVSRFRLPMRYYPSFRFILFVISVLGQGLVACLHLFLDQFDLFYPLPFHKFNFQNRYNHILSHHLVIMRLVFVQFGILRINFTYEIRSLCSCTF